MAPLSGIRVLAVEQYGAGPFGTLYLADLGAEIIKVEDPTTGGDVGRYVPPYTIEQDSLFYQAFNRGKKSITLNLRTPEGKTLFRRLAAQVDVVFNNLRGDEPTKLGLDYAHLRDVNPAVVCTSLSGFGLTGPRRAEPGYDYLIQGLIGIMSLTGDPAGPPTRAGISVIDFVAGITAALGTLAAVNQARLTGQGCDVDVSLMDSGLALLNYVACWQLNAGFEPTRLPDSAHPSLVPSQVFRTADGHLVIMCQKEKFWQRLCELMGRPELATDPRFRSFADRYANRDVLLPLLRELFAQRTTAAWLDLLHGQVPCAPVNTVAQALADPHVAARGMIVNVPHPHWGSVREIGCPIKITAFTPDYGTAPALGADTEAVLSGMLALAPDEIAELRSKGVV